MTTYISMLQLKGGVGKTTITANLAGYLVDKGHTVLTVDADMQQGTLTAWAGLYTENKKTEKYDHATAHDLEELMAILEQSWGQFDYVLIDAPPRMAEIMRALIMASDLVLLPLSVTSPEIWAMEDTNKLLKTAMEEKPDLKIKLVFNRMKDTSGAFKIRNAVIDNLGLPHIQQILSDYDTYQTVIGKGTHASAYYQKKPKAQFKAFAKEVLQVVSEEKSND